MSTTNLGLYQMPTTSPDYQGGTSAIAQVCASLAALDGKSGVENEAASGAIGIKQGLSVITKAGIAAMTLALPVPGLPSAGGDDGKTLTILSTGAYAHTVTTPTNGLNGASHVATFAHVGDYIELRAFAGSWWVLANNTTLS